jgi:signal transduction histidine kinase
VPGTAASPKQFSTRSAATWGPAWLTWLSPTPGHLIRSLLLVTLCWLSSMVAVSFHATAGLDDPAEAPLVFIPITLLAFLTPWTVCLRDRYPVAVTLGASALPVLLPYDALTSLVCLPAVYALVRTRWILICTGAVALAVLAAMYRDIALPEEDQIFATSDPAGGVDVLPVGGYVFLGVACLTAAIATGLVRRAVQADRRTTVVVEHAAQDAEQHAAHAAVMQDRLTRTAEREAIAREVHDTVAHSLSQIALQASALESGPDATPELQEATARIRASARQAGAELRGVLTTLRTGAEGHAAVSFDDLARLLLDLRDQGTRISSAVFVSEGHTAANALTRACYRIVQESVTNAFKHAPGLPVDITLRGAPATGVTITVSNPLPDDDPSPPLVTGAGSGIAGMTERAQLAGGTLTAGPTRRQFLVKAHLPWTRIPPDAPPQDHPAYDTHGPGIPARPDTVGP